MATDDDLPFIVFGAPDIQGGEIDEVVATLESRWIGTGPRVAQFEQDFADYKSIDARKVAAVNSCTAALHVSMVAADLEPGDEVITTAMTFCATANAIIHAGATPVIADIDSNTLNIDVDDVRRRITPQTRAIVPVHFAGRPCDMDAISSIAEEHDLLVIEDCAHAIETEWRGRPAGTFGDFGCFSFYVTKNVVTGEGGMVVARSREMIDRIRILALHGMSKDAWKRFGDDGYRHYDVVEAGFKYNMMDLQAALGIHQLRRVEDNWSRRKAIWDRYQQAFADLPLGRPAEPETDTRHGYHLYTIAVSEATSGLARDEFLASMTRRGIGVGVHYRSLAQQPYYQERYGWRPGDCPNAMRCGDETVSLPLSPALGDDDVERVIATVDGILKR